MAIVIKNSNDIGGMRQAGHLACTLLDYIAPHVQPGVSTQYLNDLCAAYTKEAGAISAPLGYNGFPKSICTSINEVVCHGIPSDTEILEEGDIVNIDVTPKLHGYHGDTSRTFCVGKVDDDARLLVERTYAAMMEGIATVRPGNSFGDIGEAIDNYLKPFGYGIVRMFGGHGIGKIFHEEPFVYHHKRSNKGPQFKPGMIFTVEPMVTMGRYDVFVDADDDWTVYTEDGSLSAQFEHTVLVTETGYEILTQC